MIVYTKLTSDAYRFAARAHEGQVRKYTGKPYLTHCVAVAELVREKTTDPEIIAAALLHDTLEDTDTTFEDLRDVLGLEVAHLVLELTDVYTKEQFPDMNRAERKRLETNRLAQISDDAKLIKICDIASNTADIVKNDPKFAVLYLKEKAAMLEVLI